MLLSLSLSLLSFSYSLSLSSSLSSSTKALVYGRENISPNVDKFMRDHGDDVGAGALEREILLMSIEL